jgi:hypothetical protein
LTVCLFVLVYYFSSSFIFLPSFLPFSHISVLMFIVSVNVPTSYSSTSYKSQTCFTIHTQDGSQDSSVVQHWAKGLMFDWQRLGIFLFSTVLIPALGSTQSTRGSLPVSKAVGAWSWPLASI